MIKAVRANNRLELLLDSAAELFSARGYQATTMRDIAKKSGMLPGSIYYHYPNKEALVVAVYEEGVRRLTENVQKVLMTGGEPWDRLETMLATHIEMLVQPTAYASIIIRILPDDVPSARAELVRLRDRYEVIMRDLVGALDLPAEVDRHLLRMFIIGAANYVHVWHRPGRSEPAEIAHEMVKLVRGAASAQSEGSIDGTS